MAEEIYGGDIKISFDASRMAEHVEKILKRKLKRGLDDEVQYTATKYYKKLVEHLVPKDTRALRKSAKVVSGAKHGKYSIKYFAKSKYNGYHYSSRQYHTPYANRKTPNTYDHWNKHLSRSEREKFRKYVARLVKRGMNDG